MKTFLYVIGDNPYENCQSNHSRGNGEWSTNAENVEEALKVIFSNMPFPGEPTGRKMFIEGISLPGVGDDDVIQVWSSEPEIISRTNRLLGKTKKDGLHDGRYTDFGLHLEIKVNEIEKYLTPARALLTDLVAPDTEHTQADISPMGASLVKFDEMKHEMQAAVQREQMDLARRGWEMENLNEAMREKVSLMNQQIGILNTYLHGTRHITRLKTGKRGTGKYRVFQSRQFLSEEIALLGNFADFDFTKREDLDKWLMESGHIWKFLPFERCILVTRVRQERKDYGDPLRNLWNNYENMQNIIWIRDGENVIHVDAEFDFHNAVFPDKNQFDRALQVCLNFLWQKSFRWSKPKNWHGKVLKPGEYDVMGKMRRKPLHEEEPYYTQKTIKARFHSLEAWLKSEYYTELLDKQIKEAVQEYLRGVNRRQMVFAVLLQGIVDNTQLLDVPKGSDLFNWETIDRYFTLLYDYSHALTWNGISQKVAPYLDGKVAKGDWIVAFVNECVEATNFEGRHVQGKSYKDSEPILLRVVDVQEAEIMNYVDGEHEKIKVAKPLVNYHPVSTRWRRGDDYGKRRRTASHIKLRLAKSKFIRVPMPPSLARQILDDRAWKKEYKWAVPLMVNYDRVMSAVKKGQNCAVVDLERK